MIIDIHGHITSPKLFQRFPMPASLADIDGMIGQKDEVGIGMTIVGSPVGEGTMVRVPGLDNFEQTEDQIRSFHDFLAETLAKHPNRLRAYVYTNPFGSEKLLQQTADTLKQSGFVGLIVNTSVRGEYLDSVRADQFFAMAAELDRPIFLHPPAEPVGSNSLRDLRLVEQVGRFCDVTVGLATIVFSGRLEKYPKLKLIGATAGGCISLLSNRLDAAYQTRRSQGELKRDRSQSPASEVAGEPSGASSGVQSYADQITQKPSTYVKRLYVDTACFSMPLLMANLDTVGPDNILFGTDSPPMAMPLQACIDLINASPISDTDKQKIFSGNAKRLFGLDNTACNKMN